MNRGYCVRSAAVWANRFLVSTLVCLFLAAGVYLELHVKRPIVIGKGRVVFASGWKFEDNSPLIPAVAVITDVELQSFEQAESYTDGAIDTSRLEGVDRPSLPSIRQKPE